MKGRAVALAIGCPAQLRLNLSGKALKLLARSPSLRAVETVLASDARGQSKTTTASVVLKAGAKKR